MKSTTLTLSRMHPVHVNHNRPASRLRAAAVVGLALAALASPALEAAVIVDDAGTARNGKVGYWSSMVARNGDVAISYYCEDDMNNNPPSAYTLRFAWTIGDTWQWTTVDNLAGSDTSMARGSDGQYQILYSTWGGMGWATGAATNWTVASVPVPSNLAPVNISMVLDSDNHPHVAYMNLANGGDYSMRYAYHDGGQWVEGGANHGIVGTGLWTPTIGFSNTQLALDSSRIPHIAFAQPSDAVNAYGPIKYATLQGGANGVWQIESLGVLGEDPSLAIGSDDIPRIAFNGDAGIVYAHKSGGAWHFETVVAGDWGSSVSMALSDANVPVLSFGMTVNEDMYTARREAGGWVLNKIDGDGTSDPHVLLGRYGTSVDVDETGVTHAAYLAIDIYGATHRCDLRYFGPGGGPPPCVNIYGSPTSTSICPGESATFSVMASGSAPLTYEWRHGAMPLTDGPTGNGSAISGAGTADLTISGVTPADAGLYSCLVSADCGSAISATANLTIASDVTITDSPISMALCPPGDASFHVTASGGGTLAFVWRKGMVPLSDGPTGTGSFISGAATAWVRISGATQGDAGSYDCVVTSACGEATSGSASLTIGSSVVIESSPSSVAIWAGDAAEFKVLASGNPPLLYEWHKDGTPLSDGVTPSGSVIAGSDTPTLTIFGVTTEDAGPYRCEVSDECGAVESDAAMLTVISGNCNPCDTNCDGSVNQFDIQQFITAIITHVHPCGPCAGDSNGDGSINQFDIQGFVECLGG